jgi:hypothetical protein
LSEDENHTSIGAMVRLGTNSFSDMVKAILENALMTKMKFRTSNHASFKSVKQLL